MTGRQNAWIKKLIFNLNLFNQFTELQIIIYDLHEIYYTTYILIYNWTVKNWNGVLFRWTGWTPIINRFRKEHFLQMYTVYDWYESVEVLWQRASWII